ncbi:MAG: GNAT family N-acetyltransferase, partial [Planctomycetales bacterium]|nr:GNAT family N-acetyltransferase [Planctomycetales bacterium]
MPVTYFKRYRMEIELAGSLFSLPSLPTGYRMHTWHPGLLSHHADVKYRSFCGQIDA